MTVRWDLAWLCCPHKDQSVHAECQCQCRVAHSPLIALVLALSGCACVCCVPTPSLSDMSDLLEDADEVNEIMGRAYGVPDELNEDDLMDGRLRRRTEAECEAAALCANALDILVRVSLLLLLSFWLCVAELGALEDEIAQEESEELPGPCVQPATSRSYPANLSRSCMCARWLISSFRCCFALLLLLCSLFYCTSSVSAQRRHGQQIARDRFVVDCDREACRRAPGGGGGRVRAAGRADAKSQRVNTRCVSPSDDHPSCCAALCGRARLSRPQLQIPLLHCMFYCIAAASLDHHRHTQLLHTSFFNFRCSRNSDAGRALRWRAV